MAPDRSQRRTRVRREKKRWTGNSVETREGGGDESVEGSVGN